MLSWPVVFPPWSFVLGDSPRVHSCVLAPLSELQECRSWCVCVVRLIADHTPASLCRTTLNVLDSIVHLIVVQSNDLNGCVVSVLPRRHLEKPFVWDVERYFVHQLLLIGFNNRCTSLYCVCSRECSGSSCLYCFVTINPCVVQCGCGYI